MRQKKTVQLLSVIVAILVMSVGYAAIQNVNLTVSGKVTVTPDQANFKVAFTGTPTFTTTGTGTASLSITGNLTATMNVTGLKAVGETLTSKFTIANTSKDLTAYLSNTVTNVNTEYFEVTSILNSTELEPQTGTTNLNVTVKLIKSPITANQTDTVTVDVVASPLPIEEGENTRVSVSGQSWKFNNVSHPKDFTENVSFSSNGVGYSSISLGTVEGTWGDYVTECTQMTYNGTEVFGPDYSVIGVSSWGEYTDNQESPYRTITFAEGATVSEEFYIWLSENASQIVLTDENSVSGVWIFKDTIDISNSFGALVNFIANGAEYVGMTVNLEIIDMILAYNGDNYQVAYSNFDNGDEWPQGWGAEALKQVDFGSSAQYVSEEFKIWLEANATKQQ